MGIVTDSGCLGPLYATPKGLKILIYLPLQLFLEEALVLQTIDNARRKLVKFLRPCTMNMAFFFLFANRGQE